MCGRVRAARQYVWHCRRHGRARQPRAQLSAPLEWRAEPRLTGENTPLIMVLGHEFLGLSNTCAKLGIAFWNYFGSRLAVPNQRDIPYLPQLVRHVTTD